MDFETLLKHGYSRRDALRMLAAGGLTVGALRAPAAWAQTPPNRGGVLRVSIYAAGPEPLDPLVLSGARAMSFVLWDRLTWVDLSGKIQPELATSWTSSPDLKTWTFELRKDVTFHNGKPFTAKDVVATFARVLDPKKGGQPFGLFSPYLDPGSVVAQGDHTVVFNLKEQLYDLDALVAGDQIAIMQAGASDDEIRTTGLGTGPFILKQYVTESHLFATRNPNYWRTGFPLLDGIEMYKVNEAAQRVAGLLSGQFDAITELTPLNKRQLQGNPNIDVVSVASGNTHPIFMMANAKPFDDNRVRMAFKKAIDRNRIVQQVFLGDAAIGNDQPIPPTSPLSAQLPPIERDIPGAKALLAQAGFPNGLDLTLNTSAYVADVAVAAADTMKEAGIRLTVQQQPPATYVPSYNKGTWPLFNSQYGMRVDALLMDFLFAPTSLNAGLSRYGWKNDAFTTAYKGALSESDPDKRKKLFGDAQLVARDDGNLLIATFGNVIEAYSKKVVNYKPHSTYHWRQYWNVSLRA